MLPAETAVRELPGFAGWDPMAGGCYLLLGVARRSPFSSHVPGVNRTPRTGGFIGAIGWSLRNMVSTDRVTRQRIAACKGDSPPLPEPCTAEASRSFVDSNWSP